MAADMFSLGIVLSEFVIQHMPALGNAIPNISTTLRFFGSGTDGRLAMVELAVDRLSPHLPDLADLIASWCRVAPAERTSSAASLLRLEVAVAASATPRAAVGAGGGAGGAGVGAGGAGTGAGTGAGGGAGAGGTGSVAGVLEYDMITIMSVMEGMGLKDNFISVCDGMGDDMSIAEAPLLKLLTKADVTGRQRGLVIAELRAAVGRGGAAHGPPQAAAEVCLEV